MGAGFFGGDNTPLTPMPCGDALGCMGGSVRASLGTPLGRGAGGARRLLAPALRFGPCPYCLPVPPSCLATPVLLMGLRHPLPVSSSSSSSPGLSAERGKWPSLQSASPRLCSACPDTSLAGMDSREMLPRILGSLSPGCPAQGSAPSCSPLPRVLEACLVLQSWLRNWE